MALLDAMVSNYMSPSVRAVYPSDTLELARNRLIEWNISALAVVEEFQNSIRLCGVITRTDLIRVGQPSGETYSANRLVMPDATVASVMSQDVVCLHEADLVTTAAQLMVKHSIHRVFVEGSAGIAGVLSTRDVMRAVADRGIAHPIADYMSSPVIAMHTATPIVDAIRELDKEEISTIVVLENGWPCGVFTQEDALVAKKWKGEQLSDAMSPAILVLPEFTALNRAASNAASLEVRSIIVSRNNLMVGVLTGLDFCRAVL